MSRVFGQIKNFVQLHTSDMENGEYIELMRDVAEWASNQADLIEYRIENSEP